VTTPQIGERNVVMPSKKKEIIIDTKRRVESYRDAFRRDIDKRRHI
jgi:hypothetical protein